jgi:hypothetical protein
MSGPAVILPARCSFEMLHDQVLESSQARSVDPTPLKGLLVNKSISSDNLRARMENVEVSTEMKGIPSSRQL